MTNITLFLPTDSKSLPHYFGKGIVLPSNFYKNKPEDIQTRFGNTILLSTKKWIKNSDCTLEIILTDDEQKNLIALSDGFFEMALPLPITRIKSIWFLEANQKETTVWNIENGTAYIPKNIVFVENNFRQEITNNIDSLINRKNISDTGSLSEKINRFDILLGGFAFMKLGRLQFMNYSENYFATLSFFNKVIEQESQRAAREKGVKYSNKYLGLFSRNDSEWSKWQPYIYNEVSLEDIEGIAKKEGLNFERKFGTIQLDSIEENTHLLEIAILATYGDRKNKSVDDLLGDIYANVIPVERLEDVCLIFGLHYGYSKFRNKYKLGGKDYNVKFKLDSILDYYTIESIYQFVFNNNKNNFSFAYIDSWVNPHVQNEKASGYLTYKVLDVTVIAKKKRTPLEDFLQQYSEVYLHGLVKKLAQTYPSFIKIDEDAAIKYFEAPLKSLILTSLENFQKQIESDYSDEFKDTINVLIADNLKLKTEIENYKKEIESLKQITSLNAPAFPSEKIAVSINNENPLTSDKVESSQQNSTDYQLERNFEAKGITELKNIAKQLGIRESVYKAFNAKNKNKLIDMIKLKLSTSSKLL